MHIQWYLVERVSLVNQVVGVQGQGEQTHGKDLCHPLILYVLHDRMFITCHIIKWISSQQKPCMLKLKGHFKGERNCVRLEVDRIPQTIVLAHYVTLYRHI